jgi:hypothetical protein
MTNPQPHKVFIWGAGIALAAGLIAGVYAFLVGG